MLCVSALGQYQATQTGIVIKDYSPGSPYPSTIDLSKSNILGSLEKVTVTLNNLKHDYANDVGVLLVAPNGDAIVLMNNAGFGLPLNGVTVTFDATSATDLPQFSGIVSGTYAPKDYSGGASFFDPAPAAPYKTLDGLAGTNMKGVWKLYVQDDQLQSSGSIDSWTLNLYTTPVVSLSTNKVSLAENGTPATLTVTMQDSSPPSSFKVKSINTATNLVTVSPASISGLSGTLTLSPKLNKYGTNTLTLVIDDGFATVQTNLTVEVAFVDQPPTLAITNTTVALVQGVMSASFNAVLSDVDNAAGELKLTVTSSAPNIVSPAGVFFSPTDTGNLRKFTIVPRGDSIGTATLTFTVTDTNSLSATKDVTVNVSTANHPLYASTNLLTLNDSGVTNSSIVVSGIPTKGVIAKATVAVTGLKGLHSDSLGLALEAPGGKLTLLNGGSAAGPNDFAQVIFTDGGGTFPTADSYLSNSVAPVDSLSALMGTNPNGTWKLWVTNGGAGAQITGGWVLNLYIAPIITSSFSTISMPEQASTNISFNVTDINGQLTNVFALPGDSSLLKLPSVSFDFGSGNGSVTIQALFSPTGTQYGTNTVTVVAQDNNSFTSTYTFTVWVTFVNHAPTISFIAKQTTFAGVPVGPVPFTVGDVDLPAQTLTVTATSDNQKLLPDSNIILGGSGGSRLFTLYPIGAAAGSANVTVTVSDGTGGTTSSSFPLYVQGPGNPLFANIAQIDVRANALATPSTNIVQGLMGAISGVQVSLFNINHTLAQNLNALLVSPQGKKVLLMGHAGDTSTLNGTTLIFDDTAANSLPQSAIATGIYKPTQYSPDAAFPAPAPAGPYDTALSAFNGLSGTNANGAWVLYVYDDGLGKGTIVNGWQLSIRTRPSVQPIADVTMPENAPTLKVPISVGDNQPGVPITVSVAVDPPGIIQVTPEAGTGGTRTLDITPVPYQFGSNITVVVTAEVDSDASTISTATFHVTVYQVNLPPVVSAIADLITTRAVPVSTTFTAWDPQDKNMQPSAVSSDPKLIPNEGIKIGEPTPIGTTNGHTINQYTLSVMPAGALSGQASISLTLMDTVKQSTTVKFNVNVTQGEPLFANADGPIQIPTGYPLVSNATPYPSVITVTNLHGYVTGVKVTLVGFQHEFPSDVEALLVSPDGSKSVVLMAWVGGFFPVDGVRLNFDQSSPNMLPEFDELVSGTYAPTDYADGLMFAPGAPASGYTTNLNSFYGVSPNGDWKLYVMDDCVGATGSIDSWMLALETSPAIQFIAATNTLENTPKAIAVNLLSETIDPTNLTVTATSSGDAPTNLNWHLVKGMTVTNVSGANWVLTITPADNLPSSVTNVDGTVNIKLLVSSGVISNSLSFPLTVLYSNQPPVVATVTNNVYFYEGSSATIAFAISDADSTLYTSNVTVVCADPNLVPNNKNNISVTSSTNRYMKGQIGTVNVKVTPATQYTFGTNNLSFAVSDGVSWTTNIVTLSVIHVYQAPIITGLPATNTVAAATTTAPIPFSVSSPEGAAVKDINVKASSSDQTLVPDANIVLSGAGTDSRTIQLTPLGAASGSAQITLTIDDKKATNRYTFWLVVKAPPANFFGNGQVVTITNTANQPYPMTFTVQNLVGSIQNVSVELRGLTHNNPGNLDILLVSPDGIAVMLMSGAGGSGAVSGLDLVFDDSGAIMPAAGTLTSGTNHPAYYTLGKRLLPAPAPQSGYLGELAGLRSSTMVNGTWQLFVSDLTAGDQGQITGGCFLTVTTTPEIQVTTAGPYAIPENGSTNIHFTVNDSLTAVTNLAVTASSDNKGLLPAIAPNVVVHADKPGVNNNFTLTLQPVQYQYGAANITLKAARSDGAAATVVLPVSVQGVNYPAIVYRLLPQTTFATQPLKVPILLSDVDTALSDLSIKAVSLSEDIVGNTNLLFSGSTNNMLYGIPALDGSGLGQALLTVTPNAFSSGNATIQLTVTDPKKGVGTNTIVTNLLVAVTAPIYPPTISSIPNQSLTAGATSPLISFTVGSANPGSPNLTVTGTSSDQTVVKNSNIVITPVSGSAGTRTVQFIAENKSGTTTNTLTVTDTVNNLSTSTSFIVTVVPKLERSYSNTKPIVINDHAVASPYPSTITISDLHSVIKKVTVNINGFTHTYPADVGLLLVAPSGQKVMLMNKAGGGISVTNLNFTFDSAAPGVVPQGASLNNATYQPADYKSGTYDFPSPAPTHPYPTSLDSLAGSSPLGDWSLYVVDDTVNDSGLITSGWGLSITTQPQIRGLTDITINENTTGSMPFLIADDSPAGPAFTFGVASGDTSLLPLNGINVTTNDTTGTNFTVSITPALNKFGTNTVTLYATNTYNLVASSTFKVNVPFVLQPPWIMLATNQYWTDAGTVADIPFDYGDVQIAKSKLLVSFDSTNTQLVPLNSMQLVTDVQGGSHLRIQPFGALSGTSLITITVAQPNNGLKTSATLTLNVRPVQNLSGNGTAIVINDFSAATPYPSLITMTNAAGHILSTRVQILGLQHSYPHDISIVLVGPQGQKVVLMSQVSNGNAATNIDLTFDSAATASLPGSDAPLASGTYKPTCYNGHLVLATNNVPGPYMTNLNAFAGTSPVGTWALYVQDDAKYDTGIILNGWLLSFVTDAPIISAIGPQSTLENTALQVPFQVGSAVVNASNITVTASTSNESPEFLVSKGLSVSGAGTNRTLTINPGLNLPSSVTNANGTAIITLTATDGTNSASLSFLMTVVYVNQAPHLTPAVGPTLAIRAEGDQIKVKVIGSAKSTYVIQTATDMNAGWSDGPSVTADDQGVAEYTIPMNTNIHFFRAVVRY